MKPSIAAAVLFFGMVLSCICQAAVFPVSRFDTTIHVAQDGSAIVVEQFDFPLIPAGAGPKPLPLVLRGKISQTTFQRRIRINTPGPLGTRHMLFVRVFGLIVNSNHNAAYSTRTSGDFLEINIPVAPGTNRQVEIRYLVRNAVRFLSDRDELYWTVVNEFAANIPNASVQIMLPPAAEGKLRAGGFVAGAETVHPLSAQIDGSSVTFDASVFPNQTALTTDVVLPAGFFSEPNPLRRAGWFLRANLIVLLPVVVLAFMWWLWRKKRPASAGISVAPRYEPPEGLTPAEVGTLIDDSVDPRDITATLVDLAVRGYVRIEEAPHQDGHSPDYKFELLKPREEWGGLAAHERTMLLHTFYGGHWTMLSSLRLRFYAAVHYMRTDIFWALKRKGMYRIGPPEAAPLFRWIGFTAIVALVVLAEVTGMVSLYQSPLPVVVAIAISAVIVYLFGRRMSAKTFRGMRVYAEILGFQEFMNSVEADRLHRTSPETFERLLPYAMALGVEHRWAQSFQGIAAPPLWYQMADSDVFDAILFGDRLALMGSAARDLMLLRLRGA